MIDAIVSPDVIVFLGQIGSERGPLSLFGDALQDKAASNQVIAEMEQAGLTVNQQMTVEAEAVMTCLVNPTHRMLIEQLTDQVGSRTEAFGTSYQGRLHYTVMNLRPDGGYHIRFPITPEAIFAMFLPLTTATPSGCEEWSEMMGLDKCLAMLGAVECVRAKRIRASLPGGPPPAEVNWFGNGDVIDLLLAVDFERPPFGGLHGLVAQGLGLNPADHENALQGALDLLGRDGILVPLGDGLFRLSPSLYVMAERLSGRQDRMTFWMARLEGDTVRQDKICVLIGQNEPSHVFQMVRGHDDAPAVLALALSNESLGQMITSLYLEYSGDGEAAPAQPKGQAASASVFCAYCGARISTDAKFCEACGKPVTP